MSTHNICLYEEISKIIPELSSNMHFISSSGYVLFCLFSGGPLGELVQWSDLITTLYILGHDLTITSESDQLAK